ncbi:MAG TPA: hypothetical protein VEU47_19150 [Candidatus Cybelea sp.]|nr:hypothetical protein [Candidatus Cybelea sp.]
MRRLLVAGLLGLGGCMPMNSADLSALVNGLAKDPAVACFAINAPGLINIHFARTGMGNSSSSCGGDNVVAGVQPVVTATPLAPLAPAR